MAVEPSLEPLPDLSPMLATPGPMPTGNMWTYEIKWDGIRGLLAISPGAPSATRASGASLKITTRLGNEVTGSFPELAPLAEEFGGNTVLLDGEILTFGADGKPSFNRLQQRLGVTGPGALRRAIDIPVVFAAFDLLHLNGMSTRTLQWTQRRTLLESVWPGDGPAWRLPAVHDDGEALLAATKQADLEGIIAKRRDSTYQPGRRSPSWLKIKNLMLEEVVIGGWTPGERSRAQTLGALMVGIPESDEPGAPLRYIGRVGTGFNQAELTRLQGLLASSARPTSPFSGPTEPDARFVEPVMKCMVEFREITADGVMRFPSYKGQVT
jgi:bifunctional non-homologous end joining protein LigD